MNISASVTDEELVTVFDRLRREGAHHEAAEVAYAGAVRTAGQDRDVWRSRALEELQASGTVDLEAVASRYQVVAGVQIPDLLHEGVIAARLS